MPKQLERGYVVYLPEGVHDISASVNDKPGTRRISVTAACVPLLQRDLERMETAATVGEGPHLCGYFDHKSGPRSFLPRGFRWEKGLGVILDVDWTEAGWNAIEGKNYAYFSPRFAADEDGHPTGLLPWGVEIGSLVNDPAFRCMNEICAAFALQAACNQHRHAPDCKDADPETAKLPRPTEKEEKPAPGSKPGLLDDPEHDSLFEEDPYEGRTMPEDGHPFRNPDAEKDEAEEIEAQKNPQASNLEKNAKPSENSDMSKITDMLNLPADADEAAILDAIQKLQDGNKTDSLEAAQSEVAKLRKEAEENAKTLEKKEEEIKCARAEIAKLSKQGEDQFVADAIKAGRVAPKDDKAISAWRKLYQANAIEAASAMNGLQSAGTETIVAGNVPNTPKKTTEQLYAETLGQH